MTKAQQAILQKVRIRPHTKSELITTACQAGCRSVERAGRLIDQLHQKGAIKTYRNRNLDIYLYIT